MQLSYEKSITVLEFKQLTKPLLYGWCRDGTYLYIGASNRGFARLMTHDIVGVVEPILDTDYFCFWFPPQAELFTWERKLININQPKYNDKGLGSNSSTKTFFWRRCFRCGELTKTYDKEALYCSSYCHQGFLKDHQCWCTICHHHFTTEYPTAICRPCGKSR